MDKKYSRHVLAWSVYILYQYADLFIYLDFKFNRVALTASYILTGLTTFYLFYFFIWRPYLNKKNRLRLLLSIPLGLLFFIGFRYVLEEVMYEVLFGFGNYYNEEFWYYIRDNIWRSIFVACGSLIVVLLEHKNETEKAYLQLTNEKSNAEMAFLRSQLNPHFLFNTLSFLHSKTYKLDPELSETVLKLSDMLRYALQSSKEKLAFVKEEIELLENYIAIFRKRFDGRFFVDFEVTGVDHIQKIEPLLLIPFVENAFKHGVLSNPDMPAIIKIKIEQNKLEFFCKNEINYAIKDESSGIGLTNVKRRLDMLYPDRYNLDIERKEDYFQVLLKLDLIS